MGRVKKRSKSTYNTAGLRRVRNNDQQQGQGQEFAVAATAGSVATQGSSLAHSLQNIAIASDMATLTNYSSSVQEEAQASGVSEEQNQLIDQNNYLLFFQEDDTEEIEEPDLEDDTHEYDRNMENIEAYFTPADDLAVAQHYLDDQDEEYLDEEHLEADFLYDLDSIGDEAPIDDEQTVYSEVEYLEDEDDYVDGEDNLQADVTADPEEEIHDDDLTLLLINENKVLEVIKSIKHRANAGCQIEHIMKIRCVRNGLHVRSEYRCTHCGERSGLLALNPKNVNEKAVAGTYAAGTAYTGLKKIGDMLNWPTMSPSTYNKYNHVVGQATIAAAQRSMENAANEEKRQAEERGDIDDDGNALLTVVMDGTWLKRGYHGNFTSLSGATLIIGKVTGKIIDAEVKNKFCMVCAKHGPDAEHKHGCSHNFSGPSSSMETHSALDMFKRSVDKQLIYSSFVADGDSNTEAALTSTYLYHNRPVKKIRCKNHGVRNAAHHLEVAIKTDPFATPDQKKKLLSCVPKITAGWHYWIKWAADINPKPDNLCQQLEEKLLNVVDHYCEMHENCGEKCDRKGKDVQPICPRQTNENLRAIVEQKLCNFSESLVQGMDSNIVEQANNIIAMFNGGKRINFATRFSYKYRVFAAILQFNEGCFLMKYTEEVLKEEPNNLLKKSAENRLKKNAKKRQIQPVIAKKKTMQRISKEKGLAFYGYTSQQPDLKENILLKGMKRLIIKMKEEQTDRINIEQTTKTQSECLLWTALRKTRITASEVGIICNSRRNTLPQKVEQKFQGKFYQNKYMRMGLDNEDLGISRLSDFINNQNPNQNIVIEKAGLFIDVEFFFLGASPDGVILSMNAIVEVKTAAAAWNLSIREAVIAKKITCLEKVSTAAQGKKRKRDSKTETEEQPVMQLKRSDKYYYQIQAQLRCSGREKCYFIIQTKDDWFIEVIQQDAKFWETKIEEKLVNFWYFYALELINSRKHRSMKPRKLEEHEEFCRSTMWRNADQYNEASVSKHDEEAEENNE